jgi:hypothetical protein
MYKSIILSTGSLLDAPGSIRQKKIVEVPVIEYSIERTFPHGTCMKFSIFHTIPLELPTTSVNCLHRVNSYFINMSFPPCLKKSKYLTLITKCRHSSICHILLHLIPSTSSEYRLPNNTFTGMYVGFTVACHDGFKSRMFTVLASDGKGLAMKQYPVEGGLLCVQQFIVLDLKNSCKVKSVYLTNNVTSYFV